MIAAALLLALASIAVITALQARATSSRDAQVKLDGVTRDFDALQSIPYGVMGGQSRAARASALKRLQSSKRGIETRLAGLRRHSASGQLTNVETSYRANVAVLQQIFVLNKRGQRSESDRLNPVRARLQREVAKELSEAAADYQNRATASLRLATLGSAAAILVLVSLFAFFYLRSRKAHATANRLADENARLQVHDSQVQVIQRLALAAEYHDDDTGQHTRRVGEMSGRIAARLGMPREAIALLRQAAPLHDVGKIGIPDSILLKPGSLSSEEFEAMKIHTSLGAAMLEGGRGLPLLELAEEIALTHHERWNGSGYPAGLIGPEIPLVGRIVGVADLFDALTHERPYKDAWSVADAVAEIRSQAGRQLDPEVVAAFLNVLSDAAIEHTRAQPPSKPIALA